MYSEVLRAGTHFWESLPSLCSAGILLTISLWASWLLLVSILPGFWSGRWGIANIATHGWGWGGHLPCHPHTFSEIAIFKHPRCVRLTEKLWQLNTLRGGKLCPPDFKAFKVLYFFFLCLDSLNVETWLFAFNKKRVGSETAQMVWGLTTLGHLTLAPLLRGWKVASSRSYTNNDLLISVNLPVGAHEPMRRWTIYPPQGVSWRSLPQAFGQTLRTFLRLSVACIS